MKIKDILNGKLFYKIFVSWETFLLMSGLRACYMYDKDVQEIVQSLPENFRLGIGIDNASKVMSIEKVGNVFNCQTIKKVNSDYTKGNDLIFKNIRLAQDTLTARISFLDSYVQSRFVFSGDIESGEKFIKLLDIVQTYMAWPYVRKYVLKKKLNNPKLIHKIRAFVLFRGML